MIAKAHQREQARILACCDRKLLGKSLKKGKIKFKVSEAFYAGEPIEEKALSEMLKEFENINLVGEKTVKVAIKAGIADEKNIIKIGKVPHVQIFRV